jgi:hypothetical protein
MPQRVPLNADGSRHVCPNNHISREEGEAWDRLSAKIFINARSGGKGYIPEPLPTARRERKAGTGPIPLE